MDSENLMAHPIDKVNRMVTERIHRIFSNSNACFRGQLSPEFMTDLAALVELMKIRARTLEECKRAMELYPVPGLGPYRAPSDAGFIDLYDFKARAERYAIKLRELGVDPETI